MNLRKFDYVYKDEDDRKHIACVSHANIEPTYNLVIEVNNQIYTCIVDKEINGEWRIAFFCGSEYVTENLYIAELATLDDVFWNAESICHEISNYSLSSAIAQGLADVYNRFKGSY